LLITVLINCNLLWRNEHRNIYRLSTLEHRDPEWRPAFLFQNVDRSIVLRLAKPLTTCFAVMRYGRPSTSIGNAVPLADATLISRVRRRMLAVSWAGAVALIGTRAARSEKDDRKRVERTGNLHLTSNAKVANRCQKSQLQVELGHMSYRSLFAGVNRWPRSGHSS